MTTLEAPKGMWGEGEDDSDQIGVSPFAEDDFDDSAEIFQENAVEVRSSEAKDDGEYPLLTAEQELELGKLKDEYVRYRPTPEELRTLSSDQLRAMYEQKISSLSPLERTRVKDGEKAFTTMLMSNLRLVGFVSRRWFKLETTSEELFQEGILGLVRAIEKFDYRRGLRFSTIATPWIFQSMNRFVLHSRAKEMGVSKTAVEQLDKINRVKRHYYAEYGCDPTIDQLTKMVDMSRARIEELESLSLGVASLDLDITGDGKEMIEMIALDEPSVEEQVIARDEERRRSEAVREALESLDSKTREAVSLRFGINGDGELDIKDIAPKVKGIIPRDRIRKVIDAALEDLGQKLDGQIETGGVPVLDIWSARLEKHPVLIDGRELVIDGVQLAVARVFCQNPNSTNAKIGNSLDINEKTVSDCLVGLKRLTNSADKYELWDKIGRMEMLQ